MIEQAMRETGLIQEGYPEFEMHPSYSAGLKNTGDIYSATMSYIDYHFADVINRRKTGFMKACKTIDEFMATEECTSLNAQVDALSGEWKRIEALEKIG